MPQYCTSRASHTTETPLRSAAIMSSVLREYVEERNGAYYVAGTRVSLDSIVQCFNEGLSPEANLQEFETLTLAQVFGAVAFYLDNQPAIDACRTRQKRRFEAVRNAAQPLPDSLGIGEAPHFNDFPRAGNQSPGVLIVPAKIESLLIIWIASEADEWIDRITWLPI